MCLTPPPPAATPSPASPDISTVPTKQFSPNHSGMPSLWPGRGLKWRVKGRRPLRRACPALPQAPHLFGLLLPGLLLGEELEVELLLLLLVIFLQLGMDSRRREGLSAGRDC